MKIFFSKKGFTLVELIAAIAIISIVTVACLPLFFSSYKSIITSGIKTKSVFDSQIEIDSAIQNINFASTTSTPITIQFSNGNISSTSPIYGKIIIVNMGKTTLSTFVPDN